MSYSRVKQPSISRPSPTVGRGRGHSQVNRPSLARNQPIALDPSYGRNRGAPVGAPRGAPTGARSDPEMVENPVPQQQERRLEQ